MKLTEEQVDIILAALRKEMLSPGAEISTYTEAGMCKRENWNTGLMVAEPNDTKTIKLIIKFNGGARNTVGEPIR